MCAQTHSDAAARFRTTKLVCTIGPASCSAEVIAALIESGMDVARLHFSYGSHEQHAENIRRLRAAAQSDRRVGILQDLCGTKVRMRQFEADHVTLREKKRFVLTSRAVAGDADAVSINIPELISVVESGDTVLLNDGALKLRVAQVTDTDIECEVVVGGQIKAQQAVHVPGKSPPVPVPTDTDKEDVKFGLEHEVDWIAQSYARTAAEVEALRDFIRQQGATTPVIAKIERREALEQLDAIIAAADGIMVARGDLGLETPLERIGLLQKDIIRRANAAGKPVITATEMLLSMMEQASPTRAEVTDITNAILDGSDAVMLSGESAVGKYPVEATRMMARIAAVTDAEIRQQQSVLPIAAAAGADAIARKVFHAAEAHDAKVIVCFTHSGRNVRFLSQARPLVPIVALSRSLPVLRRCALLRGVVPLPISGNAQDDNDVALAKLVARQTGLATAKDRVIIVADSAGDCAGVPNPVRVEIL